MEEITVSAMIMAAPLLVMGFCWVSSRYALYTLLVLTIASVAVPVVKEFFALTELSSLIGYLGMTNQLVLCVMSLIFGWMLAAAGPRLSSTRWTAFLSGVFMGPLVSVFYMRQLVRFSPKDLQENGSQEIESEKVDSQDSEADVAALGRLCLAAVAGGCLARSASAPIFLMLKPWGVLMLLPAACILLFVSDVRQDDFKGQEVNLPPLIVASLVFLGAVFMSDQLLWFVSVGSVVLIPLVLKRTQRPSITPVLWGVGVLPVALIAVLGGGPELISWGLESIQVNYAEVLSATMCCIGFVFSALTDPTAAGVVAFSLMSNALDLKDSTLVQQLGVGVALGGIAPILLLGIFSQVYKRLFLGLGLSLAVVQVLFMFA